MGYVQLEGKEIVFPMTYTIAEAYVRPNFKLFRSREIDLLCTLRQVLKIVHLHTFHSIILIACG